MNNLYEHQLVEWPLARENYAGLKNVTIKNFNFNNHILQVQFNPGRIISSAAKVDSKSLNERPCFLCPHNRPAEQEGIAYNDCRILLNPYPVFHHHFTIPSEAHLPQRIQGRFRPMLDLAEDLSGSVIIYNGPNCGASAPDHFHFQAIPKGILPVETGFADANAKPEATFHNTEIYRWKFFPTHPLTLTGPDPDDLDTIFNRIYDLLLQRIPASDEPMLNLLVYFEAGKWIIHIFPRRSHRPKQYFAAGADRILFSPGSIDMGGVLVMPREEDFNRISIEDIDDILRQVCVDDGFIRELILEINRAYDKI